MTETFYVLETPEDVAVAAAEAFVEVARDAAAARGRAFIALPGGRTPLPAFGLLADPAYRDRVPWPRVEIFWADERAVGPDDPDLWNANLLVDAMMFIDGKHPPRRDLMMVLQARLPWPRRRMPTT